MTLSCIPTFRYFLVPTFSVFFLTTFVHFHLNALCISCDGSNTVQSTLAGGSKDNKEIPFSTYICVTDRNNYFILFPFIKDISVVALCPGE